LSTSKGLSVRRPTVKLPAGAVDCHFHVFGPRSEFAYAEDRSYTPPDAPLPDYEALAARIGFSRAVIVQPSVYGVDNRRTLTVLRETSMPMRAVVVLDPEVSESEIDALHRVGVQGVRINLLFKAGLGLGAAPVLADKVRHRGWNLQFLADVSQMDGLGQLADRLNLPLVFDHIGHIPTDKGVASRSFQTLVGLVHEGRAWVKLSGAERSTSKSAWPYDDVRPYVEALVEANFHQLIWGTDWPHPSVTVAVPDDSDLLEMMTGWIGRDGDILRSIFVRNPEKLYGFDPA
jgi:predicted TIM-barrel fold metal-dependent hydrolase